MGADCGAAGGWGAVGGSSMSDAQSFQPLAAQKCLTRICSLFKIAVGDSRMLNFLVFFEDHGCGCWALELSHVS